MASSVFAMLNLKDQDDIAVLDAPESFEGELRQLKGVNVRRSLSGVRRLTFVLAFVTQRSEVERLAASFGKLAEGDAVVWFAYPKGTSRRYKSDVSRDGGWQAVGDQGFEPVRMVAIDEDWSAVRYRRVEFIKKMTRDPRGAMTSEGKARTRR